MRRCFHLAVESSVADASSARKERLNSQVAVTVALLAAFMAITKVKDDNIVQAMQQAKMSAVDTWGEYQSKKVKHHLAELGINQLDALSVVSSTNSAVQLARMKRGFETEIERYRKEEQALTDKARGFEKEYDKLNFRDDQFDLSDGALSVALGVLAVAAVTSRRWLLVLAWSFGAVGLVLGLAGLFKLTLHPDWLVKFLS
jgi:hypothetical protein